ncbi:hypothetical protein ACFLRC_03985, partial [Candidatus Altiarchaeota archaeon]
SLVDDDIDVGDDFVVELLFEDADASQSVDVEIEITVEGVTVFLDEDYSISFSDGEDKTVSIDSDDFPGSDLDHDYWNDNLMNYECGDFDVEVFVTGNDLDNDVDGDDRLTIGDNNEELSFEMDPDEPSISEDIKVTVLDEDDNDLQPSVEV